MELREVPRSIPTWSVLVLMGTFPDVGARFSPDVDSRIERENGERSVPTGCSGTGFRRCGGGHRHFVGTQRLGVATNSLREGLRDSKTVRVGAEQARFFGVGKARHLGQHGRHLGPDQNHEGSLLDATVLDGF